MAEGAQISLTRSEIKAWIAITGLTLSVGYELAGKRVELLKDIKPDLARLAVLKNPAHLSTSLHLSEAQKAAKVLGLAAKTFDARSPADLPAAFAAARGLPAAGFFFGVMAPLR